MVHRLEIPVNEEIDCGSTLIRKGYKNEMLHTRSSPDQWDFCDSCTPENSGQWSSGKFESNYLNIITHANISFLPSTLMYCGKDSRQ